MVIGVYLLIGTLVLFTLLLFIGGVCRTKLYAYYGEKFASSKVAGECVEDIFHNYKISKEMTNITPEDNNDNIIDEIPDFEEADSNNSMDNEDVETENQANGRVYEQVSELTLHGSKPSTGRTYDVHDELDIHQNDTEKNRKKISYNGVQLIKGKQRYSSKPFGAGVQLSEDVCYSDSIPANCIASYYATKSIESLDKPFVFKLLSFFTFIPRLISNVSWIVSIFFLFYPIEINETVILWTGCISFISALLSCLDSIYCFELVNVCIFNMLKTGNIHDDNEKYIAKETLSLIAFVESTHFMKTLRWFFNKILGYNL